MTETAPPKQTKTKSKKVHRRFGRGMAWVLNHILALSTVVLVLLGALVWYLKGTPLAAPDWARAKIEAQLAEVLPQARVQFGEMVLIMEEDWQPRVRLRDVVVRTPDGQDIVRLNEMKATFAAAPLLDGKIQPRQISISGVTAQIDREVDGRVRLSAVDGGTPTAQNAANLPQLIGRLDTVLARPALSTLRGVDLRALTLRYEDARAGRAWTVDGGRIVLTRNGDELSANAALAVLSGGAGAATLSANYTSKIGETAAEFGVSFEDLAAGDIAAQGPAFAWLGVLRAPISGAVRTGLHEDGGFSPIAATLQIGAGVVQPNAATDPVPFSGGRSYFSYDPNDRLLTFDTLSVDSKWITGEASGTAVLGVDETTGELEDLTGQITLSNLSANPLALYPEAVALDAADVDFRLTLNPFKISLGRAQISDQDRTLLLDGALQAAPDGWHVAVDGQMDAIDPRRLLALWPKRAVPGTRRWLDANLIKGDVTNIDLALRRAPGMQPQTYVAFEYDVATVRFAKIMPPITGARGHFTLSENRLVITVDEGTVTPPEGGGIDVPGSAFIIPDVTVKDGAPSVVRLETSSSITAALSLLNLPPLSVMDKAGLEVALADGRAEMTGTLTVPLKPKARVGYYMSGILSDVRSDVLVKDRTLAADRLDVIADGQRVSIDGAATLDEVPFDGGWQMPLGPDAGPGQVTGEVTMTPETLATFGVALPPGSIAGSTAAQLEITLPKGAQPAFALRSDLRGLRLAVPEVSWSKPAAAGGLLDIAGRFGSPPSIDAVRLEGPGLRALGSIQLKPDASLERVRFDSLEVGRWLDVPLDLVGRGAGRPVAVVLRGGDLDLRQAEFESGQSGRAGVPLELRLDRLQITDAIALTNVRGAFETGSGLDGSFEALLNGQAPVRGRVTPQNGRAAVQLQSPDAGTVLRAAGLLRQVVGGNLSLLLLPVGSGGAFDGRLTASNLRVKNAPGIAALLNAVSVVGLINELNGDGIYFDDVEASFRLTPKGLTLTEASAVGSSMGLSMDGTYALDTGQLGLQGVISPVYLLNGIGSLFTRKGEGLIGFNYTLTGTAQAPKVGVNPLSALTPAMFREIFRAPPPELPEVDGVSESTLPKAAPAKKRPVEERAGDR